MVTFLSTPSLRPGPIAPVLALAFVLGVSSTGWSQEGGESSGTAGAESETADSPAGDSSSAESESASESGGEERGQQAKEDEGPDPDDPDYWSKVRRVQTVQKREFQKVGRFAINVYGGVIPNNIFERFFPVGIRANYFLEENIGLELSASRSFESSTSLKGVVEEPNGINARSIKVADSQVWRTNFGVLWSPSYGKAAFYDAAIGYFDMYVFGGAGMIVTKTPEFPNQPDAQEPSSVKAEGVLGLGLAWYLGEHVALRADFRQFLFQKNSDVGGVANPSEISLGAGWFF